MRTTSFFKKLFSHTQKLFSHPRTTTYLFGLLLITYFVLSFIQHYNIPLLGDLCKIIVPAKAYQEVLQHPLGLPALLEGKTYAAPNRFLAHTALMGYYQTVPQMLQVFLDPVNSLYAATALIKTLFHGGLVVLIGRFAIPNGSVFHKSSLAIMLLVAPLFQINGYNLLIGVIDKSVAYTFNYGGSLLMVGLFFLPYRKGGLHHRNQNLPWVTFISLLVLGISLPFMGPMNAPVLLLVVASLVLIGWWNNYYNESKGSVGSALWSSFWQVHPKVLFIFTVAVLAALYSIYIGQFNVENQWSTLPLLERFQRLPEGFAKMFFSKPGPALMLGFILLNSLLVRRYCSKAFNQWYFHFLLIFGILALLFTLLLPFGGYRDYRPLIIRRDTYTPVLLGLFFLYGVTTYHLLKSYQSLSTKILYSLLVAIFTVVFMKHDQIGFKKNNCEQYAIRKIQNSPKDTVKLKVNCSVLSWGAFKEPGRSAIKTEALQKMGVLERKKWFYHEE